MDINTLTLGEIVVLVAGISTIVGFVVKFTSPWTEMKKRISDVESHMVKDNERLKELESDTKMILKATRTLVLHSVTQNSTGELKRVQEEIDNYLISK